ncbi:MAG: pantoate--beta-alanine ligase [Candidatus Aminicenantes bacterium]|nr:pantoate--beta-alanine ligase [Candidatus Aminicenantes bacterium]
MEILTTLEGMRQSVQNEKRRGRTIGLVPTMGFLHAGHLSLVRISRAEADVTVVSLFVNPIQFGPKEDLKTYPRDFDRDAAMLRAEGADYLFAPTDEDMYPREYRTFVEVRELQDRLCGRTRPGHFRGVCTVVLKLFDLVEPDCAVFGQKDVQQALILKRMVADLNVPVRMIVAPIVREPDGLAMSSRNTYLNPEERQAALVLSRSLAEARAMIDAGERNAGRVLSRIRSLIDAELAARIEYVEAVDPDGLMPVAGLRDGTLIALAVFIGRTRLIDNLIVS